MHVFLSFVTTEPRGEGSLLRVAALREGGEKPFERLVRAPRLTLSQARFSGLTNAQLDEAPDLDIVLQDLVEFGDGAKAWIVAEGESARTALREAASETGVPGLPTPPLIGIDELAAVVLPTTGRGLRELGSHYKLTVQTDAEKAPDLAADPALLQTLWKCLNKSLLELPLPLIAEMNWLLAKTLHPLRTLLKEAEAEAVKTQFSETFSSGKMSFEKLFRDFSDVIKRLAPDEDAGREASFEPPREPLSADEIAKFMGPGGPLARALEGYEERGEQVEMAQRVAQALSEGKHLIAEAGTGVGKSLAYLVPAILFAKRAGRPVIVSTNTKNLQAQLFNKDLPVLRENLGVDFESALLKGRPNYLCLRKFMYTIREAAHELDDDDRASMLSIMTWATKTDDGDVSELSTFSREQQGRLWDRLHTVGDDCLKRQCPFYNRCFVYKARGNARKADVVVLNHALVFSSLNQEAGTLPAFNEIVFDEAHTLEDVATEHLACEVTPQRIYKILSRLFRSSTGQGAGKGLLPVLLTRLEEARSEIPASVMESTREHVIAAMQAIDPAVSGSDSFFDTLRQWTDQPALPADDAPESTIPRERGRGLAAPAPGPLRSKYPPRKPSGDERKRFSAQTLRADESATFMSAKENIISRLGRLRQALEKLNEDFAELRKVPGVRVRELNVEIGAQNNFLAELIHDIEFVVQGSEPNYVYWCAPVGRRAARAVAAPLDVAALLHGQLYEKMRSIIFASATLSVRDPEAEGSGFAPMGAMDRGPSRSTQESPSAPAVHPKSFEFLKNRLGLSLCEPDKVGEMLLGSPFDYEQNCRLLVPTFIPEPGAREKDFNAAFTAMLAELILASEGRALILYTSYAALDSSAQVLRKTLSPEGIEVLAQRADGSRESLLERLKAGRRTVLLGTASFWEGVDVRGDALSLLVIAKLPFAVFTDPIIQGRCEMLEASGKDAFLHYSIPNAILRLRQGFGRLIRSKSDRGIVVLADKRVLTRRYGAAFLRALPARAHTMTSQQALTATVKQFLGK